MRKFLLVVLFNFFAITCLRAQSDQTVVSGSTIPAVNFTGAGCVYTWTHNNPAIGLPASGTGTIPAFTAVNTTGSPIVATIVATPAPSGFAYIANNGSNNVSVISTQTKTVVATIPVGSAPFGISVNPNGTFVYITNQGSNNVSVINAITNTVTATIPVGAGPRGIVVSPDGNTVYVANYVDNNVSVISAATNTVIATIPVGNAPYGIAISPNGAKVYVANYDSNTISVISTSSGSVILTIPVGLNPTGVAISPDGTKGYVSTLQLNSVMGFNTSTGAILGTARCWRPIGLVVSPDGKRVYVSAEGGFDTIVLTSDYSTINQAGGTPEGISLTPDASWIYFVVWGSNSVYISDINFNPGTTVQVGNSPISLGNFISKGPGCTGTPITFTITVKPTPAPILTASQATGHISACAGTASVSPNIQQFTVSGTNLQSAITATAPAGFELSLDAATGYGTNVTLTQTGGAVSNMVVYVRSAASAVTGNISGNVTLSSPGSASQTVAVSGIVNALPTVNKVTDQTVINGTATAAVNFSGTAGEYTWVNNQPGIGLAASGTGNIAPFTAVNNGSNPIVATITATPAAVSYAYITNSASNSVSVINLATNTVVTTIPMGPDPQDVYTSNDGSHVYVSDPIAQTVSVINTATNSVEATIATGQGAFSLVVSPDNSRLYLVDIGTDYSANNIEVISTVSNSIISSIVLTSRLSGISLSADGTIIYAANIYLNTVSVINISTGNVIATIPVGNAPQGMVTSPDGSKVYVTNSSSNTVSVISTLTNTVVATISVGNAPYGIAESADGTRLNVSNYSDGSLSIINTADNTVLSTVNAGSYPMGVSVSPDGSQVYVANSNSATVTVINAATGSYITAINVGQNPFSLGRFISPGSGCPGIPVSFTITVKPNLPAITATGTLTALHTIYGQPSSTETFKISDSNLTSGILVTSPSGFELSTDGVNFSSTVTIAANNTNITVYIRLTAATPVGNYEGDIVCSTPNAPSVMLSMPNSTVTPAPLTITADNKVKVYGAPNPILTVTYSGFVNKDNEAVLNPQVTISTTATATSAVGQYPIIAYGAGSANYTFTYIPGTMTVQSLLLVIPNTFTPNGDGINDTWNIKNLESYPNSSVNIFNRWGQKIFTSIGYPIPWDGKYNGNSLPVGTYYYVIDPKNGLNAISGWVAIIR